MKLSMKLLLAARPPERCPTPAAPPEYPGKRRRKTCQGPPVFDSSDAGVLCNRKIAASRMACINQELIGWEVTDVSPRFGMYCDVCGDGGIGGDERYGARPATVGRRFAGQRTAAAPDTGLLTAGPREAQSWFGKRPARGAAIPAWRSPAAGSTRSAMLRRRPRTRTNISSASIRPTASNCGRPRPAGPGPRASRTGKARAALPRSTAIGSTWSRPTACWSAARPMATNCGARTWPRNSRAKRPTAGAIANRC